MNYLEIVDVQGLSLIHISLPLRGPITPTLMVSPEAAAAVEPAAEAAVLEEPPQAVRTPAAATTPAAARKLRREKMCIRDRFKPEHTLKQVRTFL